MAIEDQILVIMVIEDGIGIIHEAHQILAIGIIYEAHQILIIMEINLLGMIHGVVLTRYVLCLHYLEKWSVLFF